MDGSRNRQVMASLMAAGVLTHPLARNDRNGKVPESPKDRNANE
jgi:hypothetical protein